VGFEMRTPSLSLVGWLAVIALVLFIPSAAKAKQPTVGKVAGSAGPMLNFVEADVNLASGYTIPVNGWKKAEFIGVSFHEKTPKHAEPYVGWYRVRFALRDAGQGPLAFETDHTAERIILYLNGVDIFRTFARDDDDQFGWNRPRMAPLPQALLLPGTNELIVRVDSPIRGSLRLGAIRIGPYDSIRDDFTWRMWARVHGTQIINGILVILTAGTLLFWLVRRQETVFGWLSLVGLIWIFRNLHYYVERPPFDLDLFWLLTIESMFVLMVVIYGFVASFLKIPNRGRLIRWLAVSGIIIILLSVSGLPLVGGASISLLATLPLSLWVFWIFLRHCIASPSLDSSLMFIAITTSFGLSVHDLGFLARWWNGAEFYLQPYGSLIVYSAFGFALGRRMLLALSAEESMNQKLESEVALATDRLKHSEQQLRKLEVTAAVEQERTRLMREIHDGIGSNLVTALAVAQNQKESGPTVDTLKRSIADLRAAIDSLEPTEGDLTLLLASFRHRMEPELRKAGLSLKWDVDSLPPLDWLEATNALHVLRIFQEIIANCIKHAQATEITITCHAQMHDHRSGICVEFLDNGIGMRTDGSSEGKGIENMHSRAQALLGTFEMGPRLEAKGTRTALWLPYERRSTARSLPRGDLPQTLLSAVAGS
jgi:signal transduction histidine kinase